jgi:hypothetical protein
MAAYIGPPSSDPLREVAHKLDDLVAFVQDLLTRQAEAEEETARYQTNVQQLHAVRDRVRGPRVAP